MNDANIRDSANQFANKNKKLIARKRTDVKIFKPEPYPVSVFMAGSPGAGKTESAEVLIKKFANNNSILHIDSDILRQEFLEYDGKNSSLFQGQTSIVNNHLNRTPSFSNTSRGVK